MSASDSDFQLADIKSGYSVLWFNWESKKGVIHAYGEPGTALCLVTSVPVCIKHIVIPWVDLSGCFILSELHFNGVMVSFVHLVPVYHVPKSINIITSFVLIF